ncbi:MAG TPA: hypothetical protein VMV05_05435 [bacterium]|nr:hypothetical protein [bacterium]
MSEITPEQFLESAKGWRPAEDFEPRIKRQLTVGHAPEDLVPALCEAFHECSKSTYDYIQYIHELATTKELDRKNLLPQVAHLVGLVQKLQQSGGKYQVLFKRYDATTRGGLTRDQFDTVYYDAIQNIELRVLLKKIIDEVEAVLQSFSLVSGDLSGVQCVTLYETSIRFQLFLQYFLSKKSFSSEELWSILFDVYNQFSEMQGLSVEPTAEELRDLHEKIQKYKTN